MTQNQKKLSLGNLWGDLWGIMMTEQAFLVERPIDEILVKIKMKPHSYKLKKLGFPNELMFCWKREKPIWLSVKIYLLGTFLSISKVKVCNSGKNFLFNYNCVSALGTNLKIKHKNKT